MTAALTMNAPKTDPDRLRVAYAIYKTEPVTVDSLNDLLRSIEPVIKATVRSVLRRNPHLIDDAVQESIIAIWSKIPTCHGDVVAWVRRISRNKAIDLLRSHRDEPEAIDEIDEPATDATDWPIIAWHILTEIERQVAHMLIDGASRREICDTLRISRRQLKDAIDAIRQIINNDAAKTHSCA